MLGPRLVEKYECPYDRPRPQNYDSETPSCSCEPHCSWDKCRLYQAPEDCLAGTRSIWLWDVLRKNWVAQELKGSRLLDFFTKEDGLIFIIEVRQI